MTLRLGEIAEALNVRLYGDAELSIDRLSPLETAESDALSFLSNPRYQQQLAASKAACVIVAPAMAELAQARGPYLVSHDPYACFARAGAASGEDRARAQKEQ